MQAEALSVAETGGQEAVRRTPAAADKFRPRKDFVVTSFLLCSRLPWYVGAALALTYSWT
jgi:hypothetical protein